MPNRKLNIVQLFPEQMNIYGDDGNAQIVCRRAELHGFAPNLTVYNSAADGAVLDQADIILGGGGQDSGQRAILPELKKAKPQLLSLAHDKLPMLMICGLYQLFGHYFQTRDGDKLDGIGLFDLVTVGGDKRLIGNAIVDAGELGILIGYENHSGATILGDDQVALGRVVRGFGNDGTGLAEGALRYAAIGTYLHGPVLSKNPQLADWLISRAAERRYGDNKLTPADDEAKKRLAEIGRLSDRARQIALTRPQ